MISSLLSNLDRLSRLSRNAHRGIERGETAPRTLRGAVLHSGLRVRRALLVACSFRESSCCSLALSLAATVISLNYLSRRLR